MLSIEARSKMLREILEDSEKMINGLEPFLQEIEQLNIETAYLFVGELSKQLTKQTPPKIKINSLSAACKLIELGNYPIMMLTEIYLTPCLQNVLNFVINRPNFKHFTSFFQEQGYNQNIPYLQNLSYNFVMMACQFIQLTAFVKPLKVYQGKEYSDSSLFKRSKERMIKSGFKFENIDSLYTSRDLDHYREKYIHSLSRWSEYEDRLLVFFIQIFEVYLNSGIEPVQYGISIIDTFKYGEPIVTSQIIARLADVIAHSDNFKIRSRALRLFDNFILWGDIEALLVANYGDQIQIVVQNCWGVQGHKSLDAGRFIYPQIRGQQQQKYQFYVNFLRCLHTWSQSYPTNEYYCDDPQESSQNSAIYKLYRLMRDKKRFIFPSNLMILKFEKESHKNIRDKLIRNQMILADINQNEQEQSQSLTTMNVQEVESYYEIHKEYLLEILNKNEDYLYQNIKKLLEFKENFENYVQKMNIDHQSDEIIDALIQNGLQLIDIINAIHIPYIQFLKQEYTYMEFKDVITNICFEYFNPQKKKSKMKMILSERLKVRKQQLKSLIIHQRSIPLWKELQQIFNNVNFKQLKSKYKNRIDKLHSSKNSQTSSSISLEIYTKTKFTKQSREARQVVKHPLIKSKDISIERMKSEEGNRRSQDFSVNNSCKADQQIKKNCRENKSNVLVVRPPLQKHNSKKEQPQSQHLERQLKESGNIVKTGKQPLDLKHQREISTATTLEKQLDRQNEDIRSDRIQSPCQFHLIPFEENKQYFTHLDDQKYKFSYVYAHIVIFNSSYLTAERVVSQLSEGNTIKVQVQILLLPTQPLYKLEYQLQNQECIQIEDRSYKLPEMMEPYKRYIITFVGTMRKIPLKLPTLKVSVNNYPIFQYILPFTINFFLPSCPSQSQVLHSYGVLIRQAYKCFTSRAFKCSETLFPSKDISNILIYFPYSIKIKGELGKDVFLWQVKDKTSVFFVIFEYQTIEEELSVKIYSSAYYDESYHSLFSFILNCLAHILAKSGSK